MLAIETGTTDTAMTKVEAFLLNLNSPTYTAYYNGKMSYKLAGQDWEQYVVAAFPNLKGQNTSENIFKTVVDLYAENLVPVPEELRGFSNILVPLLTRGEAPVLVDKAGTVHFPEHFEMMSDGTFTIAAIFTRSLVTMKDNVTFAYSDGKTRLFSKPIPDDFAAADRTGYEFVEELTGNELFRFALDDKGFGATLAALQDRVNHSILDQTVIAEMYARPFWYLLNVELPPKNPYLPAHQQGGDEALQEQKAVKGSGGRIFTTSAGGPFGQLTPPTIQDMVAYHDSIINKVPLTTGIPAHYFKPGEGTPPTGVALKVLSKRFNNRISRIRDDLQPELERLCTTLGVEKTVEVKTDKPKKGVDAQGDETTTTDKPQEPEMEFALWNTDDDLLQESLDAHGIALSQMGYPLSYIVEVVTPGVDLADYEDDSLGAPVPPAGAPGQPVDMTAAGQQGLQATPGQVQAYGQNPGQRAKA
ncbi:portal protein [Microbacterium phage Neferthena]|uniref:Portal protein n=1 Tax=Microbacterium phage Neferthena TaxID=2301539 RepID=A0A385D3B7_9CAUD|nr:portal protein [Microbacterium phage Neferthena]AXQ52868.1 portal protein [Microbacterium phage Neferthena]